ncbi:MAG: LPS-assembly protein LptD [Bacteriovoracia bacterium]
MFRILIASLKDNRASAYWLLALIIFSGILSPAFALDNPQLTLGDKISVFSDKAYRKNNGRYFEAVGNVVVISQKDTLYGEVASLDQDTMTVKVEGNVRFITKDLTLYGSHLDYNLTTGAAHIKNARILTTSFNLVATELTRVNEKEYIAKEAEFTTCKDCVESWSVYGNFIKLRVGKYVEVKHGLLKVKGVDVIYIPYLVFPILSDRETGILVPRISSRTGEGLSYEQPFFWAIDESKDATISPTFWAKRGYGGDLQYRQRFSELSWFELNGRMLNDKIYEPGKSNNDESGEEFFRYFSEVESHQFWSPDLNSHIRYTAVRDLDIVRDHPQYTDPKTIGSDFGLYSFFNWRQDLYSFTAEADYRRNQLYSDPISFDTSYVQVLPRATFSTIPYSFLQTKVPFFQHMAVGTDASFTRFRQVIDEESTHIRNADRFSMQPYLLWHFFTWGPVSLKSRYTFDLQTYDFEDPAEPKAGKNAGLIRTEVSFTMDKIFGLAYEEKIPLKYVSEDDLKRLRESREQGLTPIQKDEKRSRLVGELPEFESELSRESIVQVNNSYRHSQEFKFVHHYIASEEEYGNQRFLRQIEQQAGQFDFEDAIRSEEYLIGANTTRTVIPPENTVELQWNNTLIRKTPKSFSFLEDDKYLRDNFSYNKIGWFNISQGYLLNQDESEDFRQELTRLMIESGYIGNRWQVNFQEFYFHYDNENIFTLNFSRRFDYFNLFSSYNYNSFESSNLNSLSFGGQVRPTDVLGVAMLKDMDLEADKNIRTVYSIDIMPHNNCWIFNLNYRESIVDSRYSFNVIFNFGDESFERYRNDYFAMRRF